MRSVYETTPISRQGRGAQTYNPKRKRSSVKIGRVTTGGAPLLALFEKWAATDPGTAALQHFPLFERRDINHKAVLHIGLRQPFIGLVNILNLYQFNVGSDAVVGAEIQHFLSFANTSDGGTSQTVSPDYQIEGSHCSGFFRSAHQRHGAILFKELQVS